MINPKILVVDDDPNLLTGLALYLKWSGYQVVTAIDAVSAITVAKKEVPDVVILDIGLPDGDGFVVMECLEEMMPVHIPIIILTDSDVEGNDEQACIKEAKGFFQKPINNDELVNEIERVLVLPQRQTA